MYPAMTFFASFPEVSPTGNCDADGVQRSHSYHQVPQGNPPSALVQANFAPDAYGRLLALQRHLHRAVLHFRFCVG